MQTNNFKKSFNKNNKKEEFFFKKNEQITSKQVRIVEGVEDLRIYDLLEAIDISRDLGLDLIEVVSSAVPPVCKIMNYEKLIYQEKKKKKEVEKQNRERQGEMKELRFTPRTDSHDFDFKVKNAMSWLKDGNKVRAFVQFKGREIVYKEQGEILLLKMSVALENVGKVDQLPKLEGKRMSIIIVPKKKN